MFLAVQLDPLDRWRIGRRWYGDADSGLELRPPYVAQIPWLHCHRRSYSGPRHRANTAMFSVVDGVLLASLPYSQPDRLVVIWENNLHFKHAVWPSYPNFQDWQRSAASFQQMAALRWQDYDLTSPGTPEHALGENVSANFFTTLGVQLPWAAIFLSRKTSAGKRRGHSQQPSLEESSFRQRARARQARNPKRS